MVRVLVGVLMVGLVAFIAYHEVSNAPLDARASIEAGIDQISGQADLSSEQKELLRVQLAIADYQATFGSPPESLYELVPKYFDRAPNDPGTGKEYEYVKDGLNFRLGAQVSASTQVARAANTENTAQASPEEIESALEGYVNPNTLELEEFVYDAAGRRDPFLPFDFAPKDQLDMSKPPLERYTLGQLKVTAVLQDSDGGSTAIVEDATGRGYTVRAGTRLGNQNGVIVNIQEDGINIVETVVDFTGSESKNAVFMKLLSKKAKGKGGTFSR